MKIPSNFSPSELWDFLYKINSNIRALENLKITGDQYGVLLTPIILSRMPQTLRLEWAREPKHEGDLQYLLDFFRNEITRIERSKTIVSVSEEDKEKPKATASALLFKSSKSPNVLYARSLIIL